MIPIFQFDPSSLTLWYDAHVVNKLKGANVIGTALDLAITGRDAALVSHIAATEDTWIQTRAANVASAMWHEKRHFLDIILTNYGALRMRQFFSIYANLPRLLSDASRSGKLLVPLHSNLRPLVRESLGVEPPTSEIEAIATDIQRRKRMIEDDRRLVPSRFGKLEIGGEALLETIAHLVQLSKVHRLFGLDMAHRIQHDVQDRGLVSIKYSWAFHVLAAAGLLDVWYPEDLGQERDELLLVHDAPIIPLCYAALACRLWKQPQVTSDGVSSYLPGERLASLAVELRNTGRKFTGLSSVDCWEIINCAAKTLFGRTVVEEIQCDFQKEEEFISSFCKQDVFPTIVEAYKDYHDLRGCLLKSLVDTPEVVLDQGVWCDSQAERLQPIVVVAASAGAVGAPPAQFDRVLGYRDPNVDPKEVPEAEWWWAASPRSWPAYSSKNAIALRARKAWLTIISEYAPYAKLVLDGRRARTMLGPELVSAEARITHEYGIQLIVDPRYAYPKVRISSEYWYFLTGQNSFRCDLSYETVRQPEGYVLGPWEFRLKRGLIDQLLGSLRNDYRMYLHLWRDWSPWLVSEEFKEVLEAFEDDPGPINELWKT